MGTCIGVKYPNIKKCTFMPARSPETTSLDIHPGVFSAVGRRRELLTSGPYARGVRGVRTNPPAHDEGPLFFFFFFFFFFFLFGWQNLERALVCVRKTAAIFPTKWVEFENPQPTNVCFDWEMYGNTRRASNERSPTLHWEATCVRAKKSACFRSFTGSVPL